MTWSRSDACCRQAWDSGLMSLLCLLLPNTSFYVCLLYLLIPPHPSGDVPDSRRPFLAPHTPLPSGLGKIPLVVFDGHLCVGFPSHGRFWRKAHNILVYCVT